MVACGGMFVQGGVCLMWHRYQLCYNVGDGELLHPSVCVVPVAIA